MLALLLMLGCADAPLVDSGEPEPEWLYGTEVAECGPQQDARVELPVSGQVHFDAWQCIEDESGETCMAPRRMEWLRDSGEVWISCQHEYLPADGSYLVVDWSAPSSIW